ncbi:MAG: hypothetical protein GXP25_18745 [Planctomycetes bacterium]|nr:hypothetical protein [Planctomycetota bacterium]
MPVAPVVAQDLNARAIKQITAQPGETPFTFVLIGDPQGGYAKFKKLLAQSADVNPRFIIVLGDLTPRGGEDDYAAYMQAISSAPAPILSVIGDNDVVLPEGRDRYESKFGRGDCFFDYAGCRFVILDNADKRLTRDQIHWLEEALLTKKRKFVLMHCPPFLGNWWFDSSKGGSRKFLELMRVHKVKRVFMGHVHIVDSLHYEDTDYLICGSGGVPPALLPFGRAQICFVSVTVTGGGEKVSVHALP